MEQNKGRVKVKSVLVPSITYEEGVNVDKEDKGRDAVMYEMDVLGVPILIVIGTKRTTYTHKDVLFYPIYLVINKKIVRKIGFYELELKSVPMHLDENGDLDLDTVDSEPLIDENLEKDDILTLFHNAEKKAEHEKKSMKRQEDLEYMKRVEKEIEEDSDSDRDDIVRLVAEESKVSEQKKKNDKIVQSGVFSIHPNIDTPAELKEEKAEDADKIRRDYSENTTDCWVAKFLKNPYYEIIGNEGNGDCFFAAIRDAYAQIGYETTVSKLRALLSTQVTDDLYTSQRYLYDLFSTNLSDMQKNIESLREQSSELHKKIKKLSSGEERKTVIEKASSVKAKYEKAIQDQKVEAGLRNEYVGFMANINTLEKFREYITTNEFWADAWAISTLEYMLKMKVIILSKESYKEKDFDSILNCGEINTKLMNDNGTPQMFAPKHYIIVSLVHQHYELVAYKSKRILSFKEIPYDIKIMILNKCMERNSGIYYMIQEFRDMKTLLGLDPDEGADIDDEIPEGVKLYDSATKLIISPTASSDKKPGKYNGESIPSQKQVLYTDLSKIKNWRNKLDDAWTENAFTLDSLRWKSVEHYMLASRFKNGFYDFYKSFSLNNNLKLAEDVTLARNVADLKKGKFKNMRPDDVKIDSDFAVREKEERMHALKAKFQQNLDLKEVLVKTNNALLLRPRRRRTPVKDIQLMELRTNV